MHFLSLVMMPVFPVANGRQDQSVFAWMRDMWSNVEKNEWKMRDKSGQTLKEI